MIWFYAIGFSVIVLVLFFFLFGLYTFLHANRRRKHYSADKRDHGGTAPLSPEGQALLTDSRVWFDSKNWEAVSVRSFDGLRLGGQLLPAEGEARGVVILFHGYHSSCRRDASVQAKALHEKGYHLILCSQRSHGESEGRYICFGALERFDVRPWCDLAESRFPDLPLILMGISMGGATVLFSAATDLPTSVRVIVADCPFATPFDIIWRTLRRKHKILPFPVIYFMNCWSRLLARFDYRSVTLSDALAHNERPILLIHGTDDTYVPAEMSRVAMVADPDHVEYHLVKDAKHGQSVYTDPDGYFQILFEFLERNVK